MSRPIIDETGRFNERFPPWGFEDCDFAFRAHLAGFRLRMGHDVWIRHEANGGAEEAARNKLLLENRERFDEEWTP